MFLFSRFFILVSILLLAQTALAESEITIPAISSGEIIAPAAASATEIAKSKKEIKKYRACYLKCRGKHNKCRIDRKGNKSCDKDLRTCTNACRDKKKNNSKKSKK